MRATLRSSIATGAAFAVLIASLEHCKNGFVLAGLGIIFFASVFLGVIGLAQLREMKAERKRRGHFSSFTIMADKEDFRRFYFPAWWRMLGWFAGTIAGTILLKAVMWIVSGSD